MSFQSDLILAVILIWNFIVTREKIPPDNDEYWEGRDDDEDEDDGDEEDAGQAAGFRDRIANLMFSDYIQYRMNNPQQ